MRFSLVLIAVLVIAVVVVAVAGCPKKTEKSKTPAPDPSKMPSGENQLPVAQAGEAATPVPGTPPAPSRLPG